MKNSTKVMALAAMFGGFAMSANALNIVKTIDLDCVHTLNTSYEASSFAIDVAEVADLLGCSSIDEAAVVSLDSENQALPQTGNNGYWFNAEGQVCNWGDEAAWFIEYHEDSAWALGNMPNTAPVTGECNIGFAYNENVVLYNVTVTLEALDYGEVKVVKEIGLEYSNKPLADYATAALPFNAEEVKEALGCDVLTLEMVISMDEDGEIMGQTANAGYWYGYEGQVTGWGASAAWFIEVDDPGNINGFVVGNFPDCEEAEATCNIGFLYDSKIVLFNVSVTINPDAEYGASTGIESLVNDNTELKVYNLQGVRINVKDLTSLKGIYIVNGKKMVLK